MELVIAIALVLLIWAILNWRHLLRPRRSMRWRGGAKHYERMPRERNKMRNLAHELSAQSPIKPTANEWRKIKSRLARSAAHSSHNVVPKTRGRLARHYHNVRQKLRVQLRSEFHKEWKKLRKKMSNEF